MRHKRASIISFNQPTVTRSQGSKPQPSLPAAVRYFSAQAIVYHQHASNTDPRFASEVFNPSGVYELHFLLGAINGSVVYHGVQIITS